MMEIRLRHVRDQIADLKRTIEQWERCDFDASEGYEWLEELTGVEGEILAWLEENEK